MEVKLFAALREGRGKSVQVEWYEGINGQAILDILEISPADVSICLINGKNAGFDDPISQSDVVSFFSPVGGG